MQGEIKGRDIKSLSFSLENKTFTGSPQTTSQIVLIHAGPHVAMTHGPHPMTHRSRDMLVMWYAGHVTRWSQVPEHSWGLGVCSWTRSRKGCETMGLRVFSTESERSNPSNPKWSLLGQFSTPNITTSVPYPPPYFPRKFQPWFILSTEASKIQTVIAKE